MPPWPIVCSRLRDTLLVDEHAQVARLAEVEHRGQQRQAGDRLVTARTHHGQSRREDGAAHAPAHRVELVGAADGERDLDGLHRALCEVVVPGDVAAARVGVAPRHQEHGLALLGREANEGVLGLQVEDVELVDARRHDQQRAARHLIGQRRVLDQLEQLVLEDHRALGHRDVLADLEGDLVGDRQAALAQVGQQVLRCPPSRSRPAIRTPP